MSERPDQEPLADTATEDRRVSVPARQLREWRFEITGAAHMLQGFGCPRTAVMLADIAQEMTEADQTHVTVPGLTMDGDVLRDVMMDACPPQLSDTACREMADRVLAGLASAPGVTVLRGPDSAPWQPDPSAVARIEDGDQRCQAPVWDGPYRMTCGRAVVDGRCVRHGDQSGSLRVSGGSTP